MARLVKKRSLSAGLPPGTLIHIGEKKSDKTRITVIDYSGHDYSEKELDDVEDCMVYKNRPTITWINIDAIHQIDVMEKIVHCFDIHPLVMEDILNTDHRPKVEDFGDYIYIILKMLDYNKKTNEVIIEQISLIFGSNFVITFQEGLEGDVLDR